MKRRYYKPPSESSVKLYRDTLVRAFGDVEPRFVPDLATSKHTWPESTRSTLRAALQWYWAKRDKELGARLADGIDVGRDPKRQRVWPNEAEAKAFEKALAKTADKPRVVIQLGLGLGLRSEELLSLPRTSLIAAVRWGKLTVKGKGNKERVLSIARVKDTVTSMLELGGNLPHDSDAASAFDGEPTWKAPGQLLAGPESTLATQRNMLSRHIKRVAKAARLNPAIWTPHTLRHLFATRLHKDGASPALIQYALGHEDISTTMTYLHITPEDVEQYMRGPRR